MIRLERSETLGRLLRRDDVNELGVPTLRLVSEAIQSGNADGVLDLIDYESGVNKALHDSLITFIDDVITYLANFGEGEIYNILYKRYLAKRKGSLALIENVEDCLHASVEWARGHGGNISVKEEPDRYVVNLNPCGCAAALRRGRTPATPKKAYPWTWGRSDVPYYCANCCVSGELVPVELRGYHYRINLVSRTPEDSSCTHLFYKKPSLIPEQYFARLGKTKTIK